MQSYFSVAGNVLFNHDKLTIEKVQSSLSPVQSKSSPAITIYARKKIEIISGFCNHNLIHNRKSNKAFIVEQDALVTR